MNKDENKFTENYCKLLEIVLQHHIYMSFKESTQKLSHPQVGTDRRTGEIRKIDWGGIPVIEGWMRDGMKKGDNLLKGLLDNYEEVSAQKVYIVMICDIESIPVRQQLDSLWYSWEDAAERVRFVNGLYEKNGDGLHAYYHEGVVK